MNTRCYIPAALCAAILVAPASPGCGKKDKNAGDPEPAPPQRLDTASAGDAGTQLLPLPMGKADLSEYAYSLGPGREFFQKTPEAAETGDWSAVETGCRQTLAADAGHLEAHWYLGLALARQGRHGQAAEHLSAAVAGDFLRWGRAVFETPALTDFHNTAPGRALKVVVDGYGEQIRRVAGQGVLVVGRRGKPWYPKKSGNQTVNHRAELYAYDLESGRYLRLSRTNGALVGVLDAPVSGTLAFVSYRKVWTPPRDLQRDGGSEPGTGEPYIRALEIGTLNLDEVSMSAREVVLEDVAELWLGYRRDPGAKPLLMAQVRGPGRAGEAPGEPITYIIDIAAGQARPVVGATRDMLGGDLLHVTYSGVERLRLPVAGVVADWDELGAASAFRLEATRQTVTVPSGELAQGHTMSWSPARTFLAFATVPEEVHDGAHDEPQNTLAEARCAAMPGVLYVVDTATGALRPVARGAAPPAARWMSDRRLAYIDRSDGFGSVHVVDVMTGEIIARLQAAGGVATDRLATTQRCP